MRRLVTIAVILGAFAALLVVVPRWTAEKAEAKREAVFQTVTRRSLPANLPICPAPGPQRDAFLQQTAAAVRSSADLWVPACQVAALPASHIIIVATTRTELNDCKLGGVWRPANVICALDEPLGFLADSTVRRTWARREYGDVIWVTSRSMAWQDHLVSEHRQWMMLGLVIPAMALLLFWGARRTRQAFSWRAECHSEGEPDVPRNAELLLHFVLGQRCRSLPGDLSQEYSLKLESGCSRKGADGWYRWQVFHSIAPLTARFVELVLTRRFRRSPFTRRG